MSKDLKDDIVDICSTVLELELELSSNDARKTNIYHWGHGKFKNRSDCVKVVNEYSAGGDIRLEKLSCFCGFKAAFSIEIHLAN